MQDSRAQMRLDAIDRVLALKVEDTGQVITAAEYNALIDALIRAVWI
ncbi:MAG: hypothetical protein WC455_16605 [Dehalococcoidia bacterium]